MAQLEKAQAKANEQLNNMANSNAKVKRNKDATDALGKRTNSAFKDGKGQSNG